MTERPDPIDISAELDALNSAISKFIEARKEIEAAVTSMSKKSVRRYPVDWEVDWELDEPDSMWLNAFSCIRPTDEFAAEVGREVITRTMQAHPHSATLQFKAS